MTGARQGARARYRAAASPSAAAQSRIVSWPELTSAPLASGRGCDDAAVGFAAAAAR